MRGMAPAASRRGTLAKRIVIVAAMAVAAMLVLLLARRNGDEPSPVAHRPPAAQSGAPRPAEVSAARDGNEPAPPSAVSVASGGDASAAAIASPAPPPTGAMEVFSGRVTTEEAQRPLAGARVSLVRLHDDDFPMIARPIAFEAQAKADEDGAYRIAMAMPTGMRSRRICIVAEAVGFARRLTVVRLLQPAPETLVDIALAKGTTVSGWVIDEDGNPVAGATVGSPRLAANDDQPFDDDTVRTHLGWATTGGNGGFAIDAVPAGQTLSFVALADGFLPAVASGIQAGSSDVRIVLAKGGAAVDGKVLAHDGRPCAGARIVAVPGDGAERGLDVIAHLIASVRTATTDDRGAFALRDMAAGAWELMADEPASFAGAGRSAQQSIELSANDKAMVTLTFARPAVVAGRAVDAATGSGLAGVRISDQPYMIAEASGSLIAHDAPGRREVITGSDGAFRIEVPRVTDFTGAVIHFRPPEGYLRSVDGVLKHGSSHRLEEVRADGTSEAVELRFGRAASITGRVVGADGRGTRASVRASSASGSGRFHQMPTDDAGAFELLAAPGSELELTAWNGDGHGETTVAIPAEGAPPPVEIMLQPLAIIAGRVSAPDGAGVGGLGIEGRFPNSEMRRGRTDRDGRYEIEDMVAGKATVTVRLPEDSAYAAVRSVEIELAAGERREGIDFVLEEGDIIEGVVTDLDGKPVEGADIKAEMSGGNRRTTTDAAGYYRLEGVHPAAGAESLMAQHRDYVAQSRRNVSPLDGPQNFKLAAMGTATIVAVDAVTGEPVPVYEYVLGTPGSRDGLSRRVDDPRGRETVSHPRGRSTTVHVAEIGEDGKPTGRRGSAELAFGDRANPPEVIVGVAGEGGGTVAGTVVTHETEEPVADALVAIFADSMGMRPGRTDAFAVEPVRTDAQGRFALQGVVDGNYELSATKEGMAPTQRTLAMVRGGKQVEEAAVIRMSASASVFGRVTDHDGKPAKGWEVQWVLQEPFKQNKVVTDGNGHYRIDGLGSGGIVLMCRDKHSGLNDRRDMKLAAGESREVDFDFGGLVRLSGAIRVNGAPWNPEALRFSVVVSGERTATTGVSSVGPGAYECFVHPGECKLKAFGGGASTGLSAAAFSVAAEPREQAMDFDVAIAPVDIVVEVPEGTPFMPGYLAMKGLRNGAEESVSYLVQMDAPRKHVEAFVAGRVKLEYKAHAHPLRGESDWIDVAPGAENVIVIFAAMPEDDETKAKTD